MLLSKHFVAGVCYVPVSVLVPVEFVPTGKDGGRVEPGFGLKRMVHQRSGGHQLIHQELAS